MNLIAHNAHVAPVSYQTTMSNGQDLDFFAKHNAPGKWRYHFKVEGGGLGVLNPVIRSHYNGGGLTDPIGVFKNFPFIPGTATQTEYLTIEVNTRIVPIPNNNFGSAINPKRWRTMIEMSVIRDLTNETEQTTIFGSDFTSRPSPSSIYSKWLAVEVVGNPTNVASGNVNGQFFYDWVSLTPSTYTPSSSKVILPPTTSSMRLVPLSLGSHWRIPFNSGGTFITILDDILKTSMTDVPQSTNFGNRNVMVFEQDNSNASAGLTGSINFSVRRPNRASNSMTEVPFAGQNTFPVNSGTRMQFIVDLSVTPFTVTARNY